MLKALDIAFFACDCFDSDSNQNRNDKKWALALKNKLPFKSIEIGFKPLYL